MLGAVTYEWRWLAYDVSNIILVYAVVFLVGTVGHSERRRVL
jgi:hypothetical protein